MLWFLFSLLLMGKGTPCGDLVSTLAPFDKHAGIGITFGVQPGISAPCVLLAGTGTCVDTVGEVLCVGYF